MKKFFKKLIAITISLEMCFSNVLATRANELTEVGSSEIEVDFNSEGQFPEYNPSEYEYQNVESEMQEVLTEQNRRLVFDGEQWIFKTGGSWFVERELFANSTYQKTNTIFNISSNFEEESGINVLSNYLDELDKFVGLQKEFLDINDTDKLNIIIGHISGHPIRFDWYGNLKMSDQFFDLLIREELSNNYMGNFTNYLIRAIHSYYGYKNYQNYNFYNFTLGGFYEPFISAYNCDTLDFKYLDKNSNIEYLSRISKII